MRFLRYTVPLLTVMVLAFAVGPARAETSLDVAQDAVSFCVMEFAQALARNSPLDVYEVTQQSIRSCQAPLAAYRQALMESSRGLSPDEVETRFLDLRARAGSWASLYWNLERVQQQSVLDRDPAWTGSHGKEPDGGIWMNHGLTEEETAETLRQSPFRSASGNTQ